MNGRKLATNASALAVGAIAAYVSYRHQYHLAVTHGQSVSIAACTPLTVDAAIIVATLALRDGRKHVWSAWALFWIGVLVSIAGNFFATSGDMSNHVISVIPALMFVGVVEVIARGATGKMEQPAQAVREVAPSPSGTRHAARKEPVPSTPRLTPEIGDEAQTLGETVTHEETIAIDAPAAPRTARSRGEATQAIDAIIAEHVDWDRTRKAEIIKLVGCHPKTVDRYFDKREQNGHKKVTV